MQDYFKRELIISFSVIGISIVFFGALFYVLAGDISSKAQKISDDRAAALERAAAVDAIAGLKQGEPEAAKYRSAMDQLLVPEAQLLDVPKWLDGLARVRQVGETFAFQGNQVPAAGDTPGYINFSLGITGNFDSMLDFLKDVELRSPRFLVQLDKVELTSLDGSYQGSTNGRVFFK